MKITTIALIGAGVYGYYRWQDAKKKPAVKAAVAAPGEISAIVGGVLSSVSNFFSGTAPSAPGVKLADPTNQNIVSGGRSSAELDQAIYEKQQLEGYYGSLGATGRYGSLS
jgi:hypothetical protein